MRELENPYGVHGGASAAWVITLRYSKVVRE
jgi:hypothetical protein